MKIGLVLGGGGARGFAHIGVLQALLERGFEPVAIAGCSMGGIVGALFASGMTPGKIHARLADLPARRLVDVTRHGGLMGHKGVDRELAGLIPGSFADLRIPLAVTAVDIQSGRIVVLREGPLLPALRATSAIPGIFSPVHHQGRILVDGALLNNVPVDVIGVMTMEPTVAVDVSPPPDRRIVFEDDRGWLERLKAPVPPGQRPLVVEVFMKAYEIPTALMTELRLAVHRPDILVKPPLDADFKVEDFDRIDEAVDAGYRAALAALAQDRSGRVPDA